jgi:hypothetical protein
MPIIIVEMLNDKERSPQNHCSGIFHPSTLMRRIFCDLHTGQILFDGLKKNLDLKIQILEVDAD